MKICHVVPSLEEKHGGPSKSVLALCRALARAGHTIDLFSTASAVSGESDVSSDERLRIRIFPREWPERLYVSSGLRRALQETDADIIHHHALWVRSLHYSKQAAMRRKIPLVVSPRGMMSHWAWHHHAWRKKVSRAVIHPHALTAVGGWHVTSAAEETEVRTLGFGQPICVAPNGIEEPDPVVARKALEFWRELCPEVISRPTAVFYGRFHQKKRVIELIDVWLERAPADWLLLLVGLPEQYTPAMLERYVLKNSGSGRVRAFSGAGLPSPYGVASLFVLPSHNENFGMAVAEAMAHSVPILVTDSTPWQEVNQRDCGWCVAWDRFGEQLMFATSLPLPRLREMGTNARTWVLSGFSWNRSAVRVGNFYAQIAATVLR